MIHMNPFGQTVHLWRMHWDLTQDELARRSGMSRPNLSAVEQGKREVTLSTLRALAVALDVTPGILADGIGPGQTAKSILPSPGPSDHPLPRGEEKSQPALSREALERIAKAVAQGKPASLSGREREIAETLSKLVRNRMAALGASLATWPAASRDSPA